MNPLISIIIPVYKVEKYLRICLDSVISQTFQNWQAICINDGSPDLSPKILNRYAQFDKRIKVIHQKNQGLSMARNNGLKYATGKYILFLDSDDFIHPQLLEICYTLAEKENADLVSFHYSNFKYDDIISCPKYTLKDLKYTITNAPLFYQKKSYKNKILTTVWSKLYRKDFIQDLKFIPGITMEDYPYTYAVLAKNPQTIMLNLPLYYYAFNPNSISASNLSIKKIQDYHDGLNAIIDIYEKVGIKEKNFVKYELFPNILKQQLNKIKHSKKEIQDELYKEFSKELNDLYKKGWLKFWGHKIIRYLKYRIIMRQ